MDYNDNRRRLQALTQNNTSLRSSVAPRSNDVLTLKAPPTVLTPNQKLNPAAKATYSPTKKFNPIQYAADTVTAPLKPFATGISRLVTGDKDLDELARSERIRSEAFDNNTRAFRAGKMSREAYGRFREEFDATAGDSNTKLKEIEGDLDASKFLGSATYVAAAPFALAGLGAKTVAGKVASEAAIGAGFGAVEEVAANADPTMGGAAKGAAIGGVLGAAIPGVAGLGSRLLEKVGLDAGSRLISKLARSKSSEQIATQISKELPHLEEPAIRATADFISKETDPEIIKSVLNQLKIDPDLTLSPADIARLEEEGITAVNQAETPYGAEYNNNEITFRDQSQVTADNIYHELGHHIFRTKLTPAERDLFAQFNGPARQSAVGRPGYTEEDLISEDFSEFIRLAVNGRIDEVPASVRGVIAKYAKTAEKELASGVDDIRFTPATENAKELIKNPKLANDVATSGAGSDPLNVMLDLITKNGETSKVRGMLFGKDGLLNGLPLTVRQQKKLAEELAGESDPNLVTRKIAGAIDNATKETVEKTADDVAEAAPVVNQPTAEDVSEAVTPAQTGVSDGQGNVLNADGSVSTPGRQFNANADGVAEQVNKNADKLQKEIDDLKSIPANERTVTQNNKITSNTAKIKREKEKEINDRLESDDYDFSAFPEETRKVMTDIVGGIKNATQSVKEVTSVRKQEKAARAAKSDAAYEAAGGGEAGRRAALKALEGEYSKSGYVAPEIPQQSKDAIYDDIQGSELRTYEKRNAQNAFAKVFGDSDKKPVKSDIIYIRKYLNRKEAGLGDVVSQEIEALIEAQPKTWRNRIVNIAGIPRAAMSTLDLSMGGRQGAPVAARNLKEWADANKESVKYAVDEDHYTKSMKQIEDDVDFEFMTSKMGLRFPAISKEAMEGDFIASDYLEKVPGYGTHLVSGSRRAYDGGLTKLRYNIAKTWIKDRYGSTDGMLKELSEKEIKDLGEVLNTFTGSGGKQGGLVDRHMNTLAATLFAPRFWAANLNRLNPVFYARLSPVARKEALKYQASFYTLAGSVLGLAAAAGATVSMDPRSADFAKIKVGNTRYDILGGQQQNVRLAAQLVTGQKVDSTTGELQDLGDGFVPSRKGIAQATFESKANPLLAFAMKMADINEDGENKYGEHVNPLIEAGKLVVPLGVQGATEGVKDTGSVVKGIAMNAPSFFGAGVQTYGPRPSKEQGSVVKGKPEFKGKVEDNYVLDNDGKPMLDEKGRVIKAEFAKDASDVEKKAALKAKQNEAYTAQAKATLSKEDAGLYKIGQADPDSLDDTQKKKFDQIKKYVEDYGKGTSIPREVKSDIGRAFYAKYNTMTKDDQKNWLKEPADDNAKKIAETLNRDRTKGLPEFNPSNELSKAYAEFEKDMNSHPEYTDIDKRNKTRAFQKHALGLNYSEEQRDIFKEGGSDDLKHLIEDKGISQEDLNKAIEYDNHLYQSGVTATLKFSKKFRESYGYGVPSKGGAASGGSGSGSGGRKGDETPRTYINTLMPSFKTGDNEKPNFSSRSRKPSVKSDVTPPKPSGKKVYINL